MLKLHTGFEEPQPETTPALEPNMTNHVSMNMTTYDYTKYEPKMTTYGYTWWKICEFMSLDAWLHTGFEEPQPETTLGVDFSIDFDIYWLSMWLHFPYG